jgi:hypothetical protein
MACFEDVSHHGFAPIKVFFQMMMLVSSFLGGDW